MIVIHPGQWEQLKKATGFSDEGMAAHFIMSEPVPKPCAGCAEKDAINTSLHDCIRVHIGTIGALTAQVEKMAKMVEAAKIPCGCARYKGTIKFHRLGCFIRAALEAGEEKK